MAEKKVKIKKRKRMRTAVLVRTVMSEDVFRNSSFITPTPADPSAERPFLDVATTKTTMINGHAYVF